MQETDRDIDARTRVIGWIANLTWVGGLVAFAAIGLIGRQLLVGQGVTVLSRERSLAYFVPFALLHELPVGLFAYLLYRACRQAFRGKPTRFGRYLLAVIAPALRPDAAGDFPRLVYAAAGSCLAVLGTMGYFPLGAVLYAGPGGFGEAAIMTLAMFPLTLAWYAVICLAAAGVGGLLGSLLYKVTHRSQGPGPG